MNLMQAAEFYITVNHLRDLPKESQIEIAFAGRSNAGKSSAINTMANRTRLAFVSKTPGRTQHINYFALGNERFLVDLPGYGYARVPGVVKDHWRGLLSDYLQHRIPLRGLVLIMDIRRPLTELDRVMLEWFLPTGKPVHCLLTKSDKLSNGVAQSTLRAVRAELLELSPHFSVQLFSSSKKTGVEEAEAVLARWLAPTETAEIFATGNDPI
ncbi:MAG: ribosome biogenesis GTP-binding protein YihA/YsxC [Betaproteobacteria bacterium]|nr:ribosome biogenesis GTP-binding protein YihA/YsxC [Betaproteobacteria bacterium]